MSNLVPMLRVGTQLGTLGISEAFEKVCVDQYFLRRGSVAELRSHAKRGNEE